MWPYWLLKTGAALFVIDYLSLNNINIYQKLFVILPGIILQVEWAPLASLNQRQRSKSFLVMCVLVLSYTSCPRQQLLPAAFGAALLSSWQYSGCRCGCLLQTATAQLSHVGLNFRHLYYWGPSEVIDEETVFGLTRNFQRLALWWSSMEDPVLGEEVCKLYFNFEDYKEDLRKWMLYALLSYPSIF